MSIVLDGTTGITATAFDGGIVRANSITDAAGGNTASINGIILSSGVLDPENRIINGAFDFWQRGTSSTASAYGSADRWAHYYAGGTLTTSRQLFTAGEKLGQNSPQYYLRQAVTGQSGTNFTTLQNRIENVRSYEGETITVLGWARRSSGAGNIKLRMSQEFGTGGSPSVGVVIDGGVIPLNGVWEPFAAVVTLPSITGKTIGTNGNDFLNLVFDLSNGSDVDIGIQTIGVDFWGIHIKLGVHTADATALYKQPELGPELARCQRYYETGNCGGVSYNSSAAAYQRFWCPYTQKRFYPSVTLTKTGGTATAPAGAGVYINGVFVAFSSTGASQDIIIAFTADAEL